MSASLPRVAVVIAARNDESFISTTLLSIFREAEDYTAAGGALSICVVNDGSTDRTGPMINGMRRLSPVEFTTIMRGESRGPAHSLNEAFVASATRSDLVLRADADARFIQSGWLRQMVAFLTSDDRIGIVAPLSVFPDGTIDSHGVNYLPIGRSIALHDHDYTAQPIAPLVEVDAVLGVYSLLRTEHWELDTAYSAWRDDEDQCLALRRRGRKCFSMSTLEVVHYHRLRWTRVSDRVTVAAWQRRNAPALPTQPQYPTRWSELRAGAELVAAGALPGLAKKALRKVVPATPPAAVVPPEGSSRAEAAWRVNSLLFANKWGFPRADPWAHVPPEKRNWPQDAVDALASSRAADLLRSRYTPEGKAEAREIIERFRA